MQDESASVQVYVLNPCLVPIPRQMDQYLILTAACDHLLVTADGSLLNSRAAQPFVAKSFQVQVPAGLNLQHRSVADFASKGCTTLKLRPREAGVARLKVQCSHTLRTLRSSVLAIWYRTVKMSSLSRIMPHRFCSVLLRTSINIRWRLLLDHRGLFMH